MDLDTLVNFGDFFEEDIGSDVLADAFTGPSFEDEIFQATQEKPAIIQQEQEMRPLPEYKPEEYGVAEEAEQEVQELRREAESVRREGGQSGFMEWWGKLPEKQKESLFRATMGAVGTGAREALRTVQQQREQEFQRDMQERILQEREKERMAAEEGRRIAGTPSAYQFNVSRGLVGQNMGG